jgi:hypothetical protein
MQADIPQSLSLPHTAGGFEENADEFGGNWERRSDQGPIQLTNAWSQVTGHRSQVTGRPANSNFTARPP